ncbi:methyltransferase [uncultured Bradyrhizobium sp.]|jgi:methylase of polypeptide subunit release factors|uniref:methyltransferase n=1 Tax=uncultured Bradyrhizobium sp. TaxID=199684 RepID=UPI002609865F|nr:methyltransferase [uncultured Bradyrhizobium sp.]
MGLVKKIENKIVRPALRWARPAKRVTLGGITIEYKAELDGGGIEFGQDFIPFLRSRNMPKQQRAFEWCSGPAFIGFSLLGNGLCETLCLADINPAAVDSCRGTVRQNRLENSVSVYHSNNLQSIPESERWDLVVSNPPHFVDQYEGDIRAHDPGWNIHREFFSTVPQYLKDDGVIVLQENNRGSTVETFREMIEHAGLEITFTHGDSKELTATSEFFFIGIVKKGASPPKWAK